MRHLIDERAPPAWAPHRGRPSLPVRRHFCAHCVNGVSQDPSRGSFNRSFAYLDQVLPGPTAP
jgi:hypothetical protein